MNAQKLDVGFVSQQTGLQLQGGLAFSARGGKETAFAATVC